jgi:DUF3102 family protein
MTEAIDRRFAAQEAEEIRRLLRRTVQDIVTIGQKLTGVKARLKHGEWGEWLRSEFDMGERTAQNFMLVADRFKNEIIADLNISPTALCLLASPSTPEEVRQNMLDQARAGERVTVRAVRDAIGEEPKLLPAVEDATEPEADELYGDVVFKTYELSQEVRVWLKSDALDFKELLDFISQAEALESQWREYRSRLQGAVTAIRLDNNSALARAEKEMNACLLRMHGNTIVMLDQLRGIADTPDKAGK